MRLHKFPWQDASHRWTEGAVVVAAAGSEEATRSKAVVVVELGSEEATRSKAVVVVELGSEEATAAKANRIMFRARPCAPLRRDCKEAILPPSASKEDCGDFK